MIRLICCGCNATHVATELDGMQPVPLEDVIGLPFGDPPNTVVIGLS